MEEDIIVSGEAFTKNPDGSWTSVHATDVRAPLGTIRIPPGMVFRAGKTIVGVDLVNVLEKTADSN